MTKVVEGVLTIVRGLGPKDRQDLFRSLAKSGLFTEDDLDILLIESRRGGHTRPLENFVKEMKRKGRLS